MTYDGSHVDGGFVVCPGIGENNVFVAVCPNGVDTGSIRLIKGDKQFVVEYECIGKPQKHVVEIR